MNKMMLTIKNSVSHRLQLSIPVAKWQEQWMLHAILTFWLNVPR